MPGTDGLMLLRYLRDEGFRIPTIFVTAYDDRFVKQRALECGAINVLHKPFDAAFFLTVVQTALRGDPPHIPYKALLRLAHSCLTERLEIASTLSAEESNHLHECPECIDALGNVVREILGGQYLKRAARIGSGE
jgi:DNA-binding response OmpR family regulator